MDARQCGAGPGWADGLREGRWGGAGADCTGPACVMAPLKP